MSPNFDEVMLARMKKQFGFERVMWFDIEGFSEAPLLDVGAAVYAEHPSTEIFLLGYAFDNGPVKRWDAYESGQWSDNFPPDFKRALTDPTVLKVAWNAAFEHFVFLYAAGIEIPLDQMIDGMIAAYYLSFPGKLGVVAGFVGLPEEAGKDKAGKALIRKFSIPAKPLKRQPDRTRIWPWDDPEMWQKYADYNAQDVIAMRNTMYRLMQFPMPLSEWEYWRMDTAMNQRGIPINKKMAQNAAKLFDEYQERLAKRLREITGLENPNSNPQILAWLRATGEYPFDNMRKGSVVRALTQEHLRPKNPVVVEVLELRRQISQTSAKKYHKMVETTNADGTSKGALQFYGAQRTGRVGGRLWQPQNVKKPDDDIAAIMPLAAHIVEHSTLDELIATAKIGFNKEPMDFLSQTARGAVQAPPGHTFLDSDLSAIENVGVGWLSNEQKILDVFRNGLDPYLAFAVYMFKQPYEELRHELKVLKQKKKRTTAKPAVLGCFAENTLVLTERGWTKIVEVRSDELVFDGEEWVSTDGPAFMGVKQVMNFGGVRVTPEHLILENKKWVRADQTTSKSAAASATGLLKPLQQLASPERMCALVCAAQSPMSLTAISRSAKAESATVAHRSKTEALSARQLAHETMTFWRTGSTLSAPDARTPPAKNTKTTASVELNSGSATPTISSNGCSKTSDRQLQTMKLIGSTTTDTTSRGTSDTLPENSSARTHDRTSLSNTEARDIAPPSFGDFSRPNTETRAPFFGKSDGAKQPLKLSAERRIAEAPTFDLVNCGPRNRYVVLTEDGPVIVHNCGYRLGAGQRYIDDESGEEEATGLIGYGKNMGIELTDEEARESVAVWRETYSRVVDHWRELENAAMMALATGRPQKAGKVTYHVKEPFLCCRLPSGRDLFYHKAHVRKVMAPWGEYVDNIAYYGLKEGQWCLQTTHGGKLLENNTQAWARDILYHGLSLAQKRGIDVRMHIHDQDVAIAPVAVADRQLQILRECMGTPPEWGLDIPLSTGATLSTHFSKD